MLIRAKSAALFSVAMLLSITAIVAGGTTAAAQPSIPGIPQSTDTAAEQLRQCAERARAAKTAVDYSCAVVAPKSKNTSKRSATDAREDSVASIAQLQARRAKGSVSIAAIAPECNGGFSNPDRFVSCSDDIWIVTNHQIVNGVPRLIGQMDIRIESSVEFDDPSDGRSGPSWDLNSTVTVLYTWGNLGGGATGSIWNGCYQHPDKCSTTVLGGSNSNFPEPITLSPASVTHKWYTQLSASMPTNNIIIDLYGNLGSALLVNTPAGQVHLVDHADNTLWGRCDVGSFNFRGTIVSNRYGSGCVDDLGPAFVLYDTRFNPDVGPVAAHVYDAIRTLPSHWGSPYYNALSRLMDPDAVNNNRAIACGGVISPPFHSCDEYPLASTYQGGNGAAPNDRSTRIVPQLANNSQGGLTSAYYDYYRIVDTDPFYVQSVLADGSRAW